MDIIELANAADSLDPISELPTPERRVELRNRAGVTVQVAATALGTSYNAWRRFERGDNEPNSPGLHLRWRRLLAAFEQIEDQRAVSA